MKTRLLTALAVTLALSSMAQAHEGHRVKVMGTVASIDGQQVQITTTGGKSSKVRLDGKTKIFNGKTEKTASDIKVGDRVVVMAMDLKDKDGRILLLARQISLGSAPATTAKK